MTTLASKSHHFFSPHQSGFRRDRSTLDHLINMETNICDAFISNEHLLAVALDLEKAYDMVWRERIIQIALQNGINGHMLTFIANFLQERRVQVKVNGFLSKQVTLQNGVPQGSVLSVTLFLMAINEVTQQIPLPIKISMYADDITLLCKGSNLDTIIQLL